MDTGNVKSHVTKMACIGLGWVSGRYHLSGDQVLAIAGDLGSAAAFAYGVFAAWGMKKVPQTAVAIEPSNITSIQSRGGDVVNVTGKVVSPAAVAAMILLGMLLVLPQPVYAGDIKIPASARAAVLPPPAEPCTVTQCSGLYVGVDLTGINSNLDILGSGLAGSFGAGGQMLGVHGGYQLWNGTYFAAVEAGCAYNLTQNFNAVGSDPSNKFLCTELIKGGFALSGLFGIGSGAAATPSQGPVPINIPAALLNSLTSPYFIVGAAQRFSKNGFVSGAGAEFVLAQGINVGAEYLHINYNAQVNPIVTLDTENLFRIYLNRKF